MNDEKHVLRIGEVAERTGLSVEALRYYERMGLVPRPARSTGGLRRYEPSVVDRVRFIKQAQALGLSLREIQRLTRDVRRKGRDVCQRVHDVLVKYIADMDLRMAELRNLRQTLNNYRTACERALRNDGEPTCPTLDALGDGTQKPGRRQDVQRA